MSDGGDKTEHTENYNQDDGRSAKVDTGYYSVQVWGDTEDSFEEVIERTEELADRAKDDVQDMNEKMDGDGKHYS